MILRNSSVLFLLILSLTLVLTPITNVYALVPGQVTGLTATAQTNALTIDLSWTAVTATPAVTGYKIERKVGAGAFSTLVANTGTTATTYSDTGLSQGTTYTYRVSAINADGTGTASAEASATTNSAPGAPTGLTATKQTNALTIDLSWTAPASNGGSTITGYKIERKIGAGAFSTLVADTGTTTTTYSNTGLLQVTTYTYRVSAINAIGTGSASSEASATTSDVPGSPTLSIPSVTKYGITISWTTPSNGGSAITGYKIEKTSQGGNFGILVGNTGTTSTTLTDSSVTKNQVVTYRVSAINAIGTGNSSNEASTTSYSASDTCTDCNAPYFESNHSEIEYPLVIDGKGFKLNGFSNTIDTVSAKTGTPFSITLSLYDDSGIDQIQHVALYLNLRDGMLSQSQSNTYIIWEKEKPIIIEDSNGFLRNTNVTASASKVDPHNLEVIFELNFVKPMEKSHIIIYTWDSKLNGGITKIFDALKVTGTEIQTDQDATVATPIQNTPTISEKLKEEIKKIARDGITDVDVAFMLNEMAKEGIDFKELNNKQKEMSLMESKIITSESQDGKVSVEKGYSRYYDLLIVKGDVSGYTVGTNVGLEIIKPDTATQTLSLYADKNGYFHVPIVLDDIKDGTYLIKASYKDATIGELKFTLDSKTNAKTDVSNVEDTVRLWLQEKITDENFIKRLKQIVE